MAGGVHDVVGGPQNGVAVSLGGGIEREKEALLAASAGAAVAVDVGLNPPVLASDVAQELEVQLVVCLLEHISIGSLHRTFSTTRHPINHAASFSMINTIQYDTIKEAH